jgi:hypothetical protein
LDWISKVIPLIFFPFPLFKYAIDGIYSDIPTGTHSKERVCLRALKKAIQLIWLF